LGDIVIDGVQSIGALTGDEGLHSAVVIQVDQMAQDNGSQSGLEPAVTILTPGFTSAFCHQALIVDKNIFKKSLKHSQLNDTHNHPLYLLVAIFGLDQSDAFSSRLGLLVINGGNAGKIRFVQFV
jgi:hypothetical protein